METPPIDWPQVAHLLLLSREMDRLKVEELTPQGKVKYQFSAMGQILLALHLAHPTTRPASTIDRGPSRWPAVWLCGVSGLDGPLERLTMPDCPVPFNVGLREAVMPGVEQIQAKMQTLLDF